MFDKDTLELYVDKGLISRQKHPSGELYIHNYTPKCAFERAWDEVTIACRGLILDGDCNIVARPFPKFFNLEEHSRSDIVFSKPYTVYEKMDGSLGILYRHQPEGAADRWAIATRGSFSSTQALHATKVFNEKYRTGNHQFEPPVHATMLFEIIFPANRIVVDYKDMDELVLLAVIDNETGRDVVEFMWSGPKAKKYHMGDERVKPRDVLETIGATDDGNTEGFVLCFDWPKTGPKTRVKVKLEEYKRLHRILTQVSTKNIWEMLSTGGDILDIVDRVPDEFFEWVQDTVKELNEQFDQLRLRVIEATERCIDECVPEGYPGVPLSYVKTHRKEFAEIVKKDKELNDLIFWHFDGKDISEKIWRRIKPEYAKPFAKDIDN